MLASAVSMLAMLAFAGTASADTAAISFTDSGGTSDPAVDVGRTFAVTGNTTTSKRLYIRFRPSGGSPCAPSANSDSGSDDFGYGDANFNGDTFNGTTVNGNFTLKKTGTWRTPGTFMFCIWLADSPTTAVTPITQTVTFRQPTGTITATFSPDVPKPGDSLTITVTGRSEAPRTVYATLRGSGQTCSPTFSSDGGESVISGEDVNGDFTVTRTRTAGAAGTYILCLWLATSSSDTQPVAGPQPQSFAVVAPPPPPPACVVPGISSKLRLATVTSRIRRANCSLGKVRYVRSRSVKRGRVIRLSPRPGTRLSNQAPVNVVVSAGPPRRRR